LPQGTDHRTFNRIIALAIPEPTMFVITYVKFLERNKVFIIYNILPHYNNKMPFTTANYTN